MKEGDGMSIYLKPIREDSEGGSSYGMGRSIKLDHNIDLLDDFDEDFLNFKERKDSIMSNVTHISKLKF